MPADPTTYNVSPRPLSGPPLRTSGRGFPAALRHAVKRLEGRAETLDEAAGVMPFGLGPLPLDQALGGGLLRAALHEIVAASEAEAAAAVGFTLALAARAAPARPVVWIAEEMAQRESGAPYGPGLDAVGLLPDAVLLVTAAHPRDVLWAMEEALRCRAVGVVIGEIRRPNAIDDVAGRRLSLAATHRQRPALLLRVTPEAQPTAAATRWVVGAASSLSSRESGPARNPSASFRPLPTLSRERVGEATGSIGPPAFAVRLVRNRHGRLGSWTLEWNRAEHRFEFAPTHPQPVAAPALDRPHPAAVA